MQVLALLGGLAWLGAWFTAVNAAVRLARRRQPGITGWDLVARGHLFFRRATFKAGAETDRDFRTFTGAMMVAGVALAVLLVASVMGQTT